MPTTTHERFVAQPSAYETRLAQIAEQEYAETSPLRQAFMEAWEKALTGEMPAWYESIYGAAKTPIEQQYQAGRENILATLPKGGVLQKSLADWELERTKTLSEIPRSAIADMISKAYGAAYGAPQLAISGLGEAAQPLSARQSALWQSIAQASSASMPSCCFNFLEAEGEIHSAVRRYRDEHFPKDGPVSTGYILTAAIFVPMMRKFRWFKQLIRLTMTQPLKRYAEAYYKGSSRGLFLWPIAKTWVAVWWLIGKIKEELSWQYQWD